MLNTENKPYIWNIPFDVLPDARDWKVGSTYNVEMVIKQTSISEEGASFTITKIRVPKQEQITTKNLAKKSKLISEGGVTYS